MAYVTVVMGRGEREGATREGDDIEYTCRPSGHILRRCGAIRSAD